MRLAAARLGRKPVIGLTALIDVVFILLLFFMLAANLQTPRVQALQLGGRAAQWSGPAAAETLAIAVPVSGPLRIAGRPVALTALAADWRRRAAAVRRVRLMPDAGVTVQRLLTVMDALAAAGVTAVGVDEAALTATQPRPAP